MRILIDATSLLLRSAGVKSHMYYWIRALRQLASGDRIELFPFLGRLGPLDHERSSAGRWRTTFGMRFVQFSNLPGNRVLELVAAGADVFHASQHLSNSPRRTARLTTTIHDMTCWLLPETHAPANVAATRRWAERVVRRAAACLAVSESARRDALEILRLPEDRITAIHPGIADAFFSVRVEEAAAAAHTYGLDKPYILFVGMIEPRKNIGRMLDAYAALPAAVRREHDLVVAGPLGWCGAETAARLRGGAPGVRYLGYVPEAILPGLTAGARMFFFPSLYEGFGIPVAQAMACGVPVVTSRGSSLEEIGGDAVLLADPRSVEEMAAALERLALDAALARELGERGRRRAAGYRWDRYAAASLEFFRRVARG